MSDETTAPEPSGNGVERGELLPPGEMPEPAPADDEAEAPEANEQVEPVPAGAITEPAKVMRIGSMVRQLLEEVRQTPLDEASRERLAEVLFDDLRFSYIVFFLDLLGRWSGGGRLILLWLFVKN